MYRSNVMNGPIIQRVYKELEKECILRCAYGAFWTELSKMKLKGFPGFVQMFYNKTATNLKIRVVITYALEIALFNLLYETWRLLIENRRITSGFVPESRIVKGEKRMEDKSVWFWGLPVNGLLETILLSQKNKWPAMLGLIAVRYVSHFWHKAM